MTRTWSPRISHRGRCRRSRAHPRASARRAAVGRSVDVRGRDGGERHGRGADERGERGASVQGLGGARARSRTPYARAAAGPETAAAGGGRGSGGAIGLKRASPNFGNWALDIIAPSVSRAELHCHCPQLPAAVRSAFGAMAARLSVGPSAALWLALPNRLPLGRRLDCPLRAKACPLRRTHSQSSARAPAAGRPPTSWACTGCSTRCCAPSRRRSRRARRSRAWRSWACTARTRRRARPRRRGRC